MKKLWYFILMLIFFSVSAETHIPAGNVNGIWNSNSSPFIIEGDIQVLDGESLQIEPGTTVKFDGHFKFNIQGQILASGTEQDSILFTVSDTTGYFMNSHIGWYGIRFENTFAANDSSIFDYCIMEYGKAIGDDYLDRLGGAFYIEGFSKIRISNSTLTRNNALLGAGIYCKNNASPVIINNHIVDNSANGINPGDGSGAAIYLTNSCSPMISNNTIIDNIAYGCAGIVCQESSNPRIIQNKITNNWSLMYTALLITNSEPIVVNNLIAYNQAGGVGGAIVCFGSQSPILINNTITNNIGCSGSALINCNCSPTFINNIIWGNEPAVDQIYLMTTDLFPDFYYCNIQGGTGGFGGDGAHYFNGEFVDCIDSNPLFSDPSTLDYQLTAASSCIDAGSPNDWYMIPEFDLLGNERIIDGNYDNVFQTDIGALEFQPPPFYTSDYENYLIDLPNVTLSNFPNPFNPSTTISFSIEQIQQNDFLELVIYNLIGQKVKTLVSIKQVDANARDSHSTISVVWNGIDNSGNSVPSGIYIYRLKAGSVDVSRKCLLLK